MIKEVIINKFQNTFLVNIFVSICKIYDYVSAVFLCFLLIYVKLWYLCK